MSQKKSGAIKIFLKAASYDCGFPQVIVVALNPIFDVLRTFMIPGPRGP